MTKTKTSNFDCHELQVLSYEIQKRRRILVSGKLSNGVTKQLKERAWEEVAEAVRLVSVSGVAKKKRSIPLNRFLWNMNYKIRNRAG